MSGRKKLKLAKHDVEDSQRSEYVDSEKQVCSNSCEADRFSLSDLPNEVLLYIYALLSPVDLAALTKLGNQRLRDLTFCIKEANFSLCRKAGAEPITAFFSRSRVKYVKELNFNYTLYIKPQVLVQLISRCKALTVLSVVECGIKFHHLAHIFQNCSQLEELAWNVEQLIQLITAEATNMKTVYLFSDINEVSLRSIFFILQNFPNIKNAWINLSSDLVSVLPFIGSWLTSSCIEYTVLERRFVLLTNSFQCTSLDRDLEFLQSIIEPSELVNPSRMDGSPSENTIYGRTFMSPPYIHLTSDKKAISGLLSERPEKFSTVSISLTSEILDVSENLAKSINRAAGVKLRHLSFISEARPSPRNIEYPEPITSEESLSVCDTLESLFLTCQYVTVLNLLTVHFTAGSPFKAISKLKYLRTLVISSCAFFNDYKAVHKGDVESENLEFKDVVSNCLLVEDFSLFCCADYYSRLTDSDLFPIKEWKHLKHLTIYSLSFRTCSFLRKVADSCKKLQSFSLVSVAQSTVCLFTPDVIYLLKNAKNLTVIRINDERFNPMYERFWSTVGEAVNLEGICIFTESKVFIQRQVIVNAVKMLKHLHLFHFSASRAPDRLYTDVKKSMQNHKVVNFSLEKVCCIKTFNSASRMQYYHQQPDFCCQHIHFRNFFK